MCSCLQTYNEIQHCFLVISSAYPEDLCMFLLNVSIELLFFPPLNKAKIYWGWIPQFVLTKKAYIDYCCFHVLPTEMQVKRRSIYCWGTWHNKTSIAQVLFLSLSLPLCVFELFAGISITYLYRLLESWHTKQALLVEIVKSLLEEQSLGIRMALAEVVNSVLTLTSIYLTQYCR